MIVEINDNLVERWCSMNARHMMKILPRKALYVYIVNLAAKLASLRKCMIVAFVSNAPSCIVHAHSDGSRRLLVDQENTM